MTTTKSASNRTTTKYDLSKADANGRARWVSNHAVTGRMIQCAILFPRVLLLGSFPNVQRHWTPHA